MKLIQVTILCLLLPSLCSSNNDTDVGNNPQGLSSTMVPSANASVLATTTMSNTVMESTTKTSIGTTSKKVSSTSLQPTHSSLMATLKSEGATTSAITKIEVTVTNATVTKIPLSNVSSTLQSSQHKTENQSSIKTAGTPGSSLPPEGSTSHTSTSPSVSVTMPGNNSQFQGTEDAKNASSSSANSSYSSIILPVVIALIVVTLSAFVLVGLYRMCWKTDPGTPENGNDQPQSDKESVKLLTVKTISHESGEHSAQGKSKN
ncbi:endomucin isoform X1 [Meles meles]|uniref:endomucin isoform X1 n=1 Tax=Meles meles TaxID=9662 RepID=UPI001E698582|nr:endomucin isoform X1 [Meles meles]XP_045854322.1 endomucin isoform X1 [Meles meles]XP_045854323.1 endomucin isoform X1 [Meles meles]XP_045854324.1 endomucin isoform X1 [Meles meles]XP_045854325.1 endomucin isoform X1 [Meles meles]